MTNIGTALVTLDPNSSETIDGKTTLTLGIGESLRVFCDGTSFYTDASVGKLVKIGQVVASSSSVADFDFASGFPADFDEFEVHLIDVHPATDDVYLGLRVKTTGSLTVQTSGYAYVGRVQGTGAGADSSSSIDSVSDRIALARPGSGSGIGNASGEQLHGIVCFRTPNSGNVKQFDYSGGYIRSDGVGQGYSSQGYYGSSAAYTGLRFLMSSGNIASGTFVLYGRRK